MNLSEDKFITIKFTDDEFNTKQIYVNKIYLG